MSNFLYNNFISFLIQGKLDGGLGVNNEESNLIVTLIMPDSQGNIPSAVISAEKLEDINSYLVTNVNINDGRIKNVRIVINDDNSVSFGGNNIIWENTTNVSGMIPVAINARCAVIYHNSTKSGITNPLMALIDFGETKSTTAGGSFAISWAQEGIFKFK